MDAPNSVDSPHHGRLESVFGIGLFPHFGRKRLGPLIVFIGFGGRLWLGKLETVGSGNCFLFHWPYLEFGFFHGLRNSLAGIVC